jgi:hypothetical protein
VSGIEQPRLGQMGDCAAAWALFTGSVAYIWHAGTKAGIV